MRESLTATTAYSVETCSPVQQPFEDRPGDRGRDRAAEAVRLFLPHDCDDVARVVGRREADEPGVVDAAEPELRGSCLAGDGDARDLRVGAGAALDDELHLLVQLGRRLRLDHTA